MKNIFTILLFLSTLHANAQIDTNRIYWKLTYKLKWSDFQGQPDTTVEYAAITSSGIKYPYLFNDSSFTFEVFAFFDKQESWKKKLVDSYILEHEQLHFDITELFARKLKEKLCKLIPKRKSIQSDIQSIANKIIQEKDDMQNLYDRETNFSQNVKQQVKWKQKIRLELKLLDRYKNKTVNTQWKY